MGNGFSINSNAGASSALTKPKKLKDSDGAKQTQTVTTGTETAKDTKTGDFKVTPTGTIDPGATTAPDSTVVMNPAPSTPVVGEEKIVTLNYNGETWTFSLPKQQAEYNAKKTEIDNFMKGKTDDATKKADDLKDNANNKASDTSNTYNQKSGNANDKYTEFRKRFGLK